MVIVIEVINNVNLKVINHFHVLVVPKSYNRTTIVFKISIITSGMVVNCHEKMDSRDWPNLVKFRTILVDYLAKIG